MLFEVELNKKTYRVDAVPVRYCGQWGPYRRFTKGFLRTLRSIDVEKDIDTMVQWFVLFCGNQLSPTMCTTITPETGSSRMLGLQWLR